MSTPTRGAGGSDASTGLGDATPVPVVMDDERRARCLRNEADAYRKAIVRLVVAAKGGGRKTMDKTEVAEIAGRALDEGNAWHRHLKGEPWESTIGALRR